MWALARWLCLILLIESALGATSDHPNILLITVDTTRADRMGFLGSKRGLTPNLDALAEQGVVFSRAYSQVPLTAPSHATILSGTYPQFHHIVDFGLPLAKDVPFLPAILHEHGYRTAAFVASSVLDPRGGWVPGFDRGFDFYDADFSAREGQTDRYQTLEHRADRMVDSALKWLKNRPPGPFFAWLHLYDPHVPYDPPEPFKSRFASDPYDGEIAFADSQLGRLFEQLRARSLYDDLLIAVMADHGEAFGEHGERTHGIFLYDETIHVPLLFKMPNRRFAGSKVNTRAGLVDLAPTILEVAGVPAPKAEQGESLVPWMKPADAAAPKLPDRQAYSETDYPHRDFGWSSLRSLRADKYLFVQAPRKELYDQTADPAAEHNLASNSSAVTQTLSDRLDSFRSKTASSARVGKVEADPQLVQKLAALGYVSGSHSDEPPGAEMTGADPKDKIEIANRVQVALTAVEDRHPDEAIRILEELRAKDPSVEVVNRTLGAAYLGQENYEKALPILRRAVELNPEFSLDHYRLSQALFYTGDYESAAKEVRAAIDKSSLVNLKYAATLHFFSAAVYRKMGKAAEGIKELELAVQLDPDDYESNLTLGRLLSMDGNAGAGLPFLKKAAKLLPDSPDVHVFLGDAYSQLGQTTEAAKERREAARLGGLERPE